MIEATPRGQPWIAVAVERDHRIAGHDAADARHPNTSVSGGNIIATFARGGEAQFVVIAAAALQDAALCRFESANQRRRRRQRVPPDLRTHATGRAHMAKVGKQAVGRSEAKHTELQYTI